MHTIKQPQTAGLTPRPSAQPLTSAMTTLREVVLAAIKSLSRGKTFLQALLAFWVNPSSLKSTGSDSASTSSSTSASAGTLRTPEAFLAEARELFLGPVQTEALEGFSRKLKTQFTEALASNPACMLPSYNHQLPDGREHGQYLALDVGGSTLRIALVELRTRVAQSSESRILTLESFKIERHIKNLEGMAFFDWMACRIVDTVSRAPQHEVNTSEKPLLMGLAWSFPIE